jgi:DNA-binding transcriptional ArsR family regulator
MVGMAAPDTYVTIGFRLEKEYLYIVGVSRHRQEEGLRMAALNRHSGRPAGAPLASLFSSSTVPAVVALLDRLGQASIDELSQRAGVSRVSVSNEVRKLAGLGIVTVTKDGNRRIVGLSNTPAAGAVRALAVLAYGVPAVLADEFGALEGVEKVVVYGSWAARNAGEPGRLPQDIDVLVVGSADRDDVFEAAERASLRIGVPVSARRISGDAWNAAEDPFVRSMLDRPLLEVSP